MGKGVSTFRTGQAHRLIWPLLTLACLLGFNALFTPGFYAFRTIDGHLDNHLVDILRHGSQVMILAMGMTLVIATGGVDLSVGAIMAISGAVAALTLTGELPFDVPQTTPWAIGLALLASIIAGMWNGLLVAAFKIQPIIATLILMVVGRGVAQLLTDGTIVTFNVESFNQLSNGYWLGLPISLWIVAAMLIVVSLLTRKTALGLFIEAVGNNEIACRYAGVNAGGVKWMAYIFSGFCGGVAGLLCASDIYAADSINAGLYFELDAILAVVIGGTALTGGRFSLIGSLIGALVIQTLTTTLYAHDVSPHIMPMPKALVVVMVCLLLSPAFRTQGRQLLARLKPNRREARP